MSATDFILTQDSAAHGGCPSATCYASSCGRVTLYLGDSLAIAPTLQGVDACITDPPYGILKSADWSKTGQSREVSADMNQSGKNWGKIEWDTRQKTLAIRHDVPCVVWGGNFYASDLPESGAWLCFNKRGGGKPSAMHFGDCELAWTNGKGCSVRMFSLMWHGKGRWAKEPIIHPTQKPVELMAWCMEQAKVPEGALVLDPYMGSGTTGIACIRTGRRFVGIEKDPTHYATALERITNELRQGDLFLGHNSTIGGETTAILKQAPTQPVSKAAET